MIKNSELIQKFERKFIKNEKTEVNKNFQIVEAMYYEAVELGILPLKNPLDGLETDIKIAKVITCVPETSYKNSKRIK